MKLADGTVLDDSGYQGIAFGKFAMCPDCRHIFSVTPWQKYRCPDCLPITGPSFNDDENKMFLKSPEAEGEDLS